MKATVREQFIQSLIRVRLALAWVNWKKSIETKLSDCNMCLEIGGLMSCAMRKRIIPTESYALSWVARLGTNIRSGRILHLDIPPSIRVIRIFLMLLVIGTGAGCGSHPTSLQSAQDIRRAPDVLERIRIGSLPLEDYPLLSKFTHLKDVDFFTLDGRGANDKKLEALSNLELKNLGGISLLNCPAVTDQGIRHLSKIASLRGLQLEGTSITDDALAMMASGMELVGINVANCSMVTMQGLLYLARSGSLNELSFSSNSLTQEDVIKLINELKSAKWLGIVDSESKLDAVALKSLANAKGITLNVSRTGALQDIMNGVR